MSLAIESIAVVSSIFGLIHQNLESHWTIGAQLEATIITTEFGFELANQQLVRKCTSVFVG